MYMYITIGLKYVQFTDGDSYWHCWKQKHRCLEENTASFWAKYLHHTLYTQPVITRALAFTLLTCWRAARRADFNQWHKYCIRYVITQRNEDQWQTSMVMKLLFARILQEIVLTEDTSLMMFDCLSIDLQPGTQADGFHRDQLKGVIDEVPQADLH